MRHLLSSLVSRTRINRQFWGDVLYRSGWRVQKHWNSDSFRLLSPSFEQTAAGSESECIAELDSRCPPPSEREQTTAVVMLHGLGRSSTVYGKMAAATERLGWTPVPLEYPSTRIPAEEAAELVLKVIARLHAQTIHLVGHSLGGIVLRCLLDRTRDDRISRMVMIGTPNKGAFLADRLHRRITFRLFLGVGGRQLVSDETGVAARAGIPWCPFGIIAGGNGKKRGMNPILPSDNDGVVTVESCVMEEAADAVVVPAWHTFQPANPQVIAECLWFLQHEHFRKKHHREEA